MMDADKPGRFKSYAFQILFYTFTALFAVICAVLAIIPGRKPMMGGLWLYTRTIRFLMEAIVDIEIVIEGRENLPEDGAYIIAAKHQSYGDGIIMFSEFFDLSFVTGNHLEKFTLIKTILRKAGAVVVDNCGGADERERLSRQAERVRRDERKLLIYPEGHLSQVGTQHKYRKGVYFMSRDFDCLVVPVATNLGQRWNQIDWMKYPGKAVLKFLPPIETGLEKDAFMERLETVIETESRALLDLKNPGALNPADIGVVTENAVARAKRLAREAKEGVSLADSRAELNRGSRS